MKDSSQYTDISASKGSAKKPFLHWSTIKEAGFLGGMRWMLKAYRLGGQKLFKPLLVPVIAYFYLSNRSARTASKEYFSTLKTFSPKTYRQLGYCHILPLKHLWSFGVVLLDKLAVWMGHITLADVTLHNSQHIETLLQQKRGAILLISHLGNFEICRALNKRHNNMKLTVLVHTKHAPKFNELLHQYDKVDNSNLELLQVTEINTATAMQLSERIEQGGFIAIAGDRIAVDNPQSSNFIDFLGRPARFPRGPFILAIILKAPIISLQCIHLKGRYHIYFDRISSAMNNTRKNREQLIQQLSEDFVALLQHYCLLAPLQWFNFYHFWSQHEKQQ